MDEQISAEFPYQSKFVEVMGSRMHYIEQGQGDPIVLLHGNPTSCYLWRNVIPHLAGLGRCIAPDLIGMGKSDKPDIPYRVRDHADYFAGFVEALELEHLRLVLHDWGGFVGGRYAGEKPRNVKAIAFFEAVFKPARWADRSEQTQQLFRMFRGEKGWEKIVGENMFVEKVLPGSVIRKLTEVEMDAYRAPFLEEASRKPLYVFPNEIPFDGDPADVAAAVEVYGGSIAQAEIPLLLLTFTPGAIIGVGDVAALREKFPRLTVRDLGPGIHFVQEDQPEAIGRAVAEWLAGLA